MSNQNRKIPLTVLLVAGLLMALGVLFWFRPWAATATSQKNYSQHVQQVVNAEELLLELTPKLKNLTRSLSNLQLPDPFAKSIFAETVQIQGTLEAEQTPERVDAFRIKESASEVSRAEIDLWRPLFDSCRYFENVKFFNIKGEFTDEEFPKFQTQVGMEALAAKNKGGFASLHARLKLTWTPMKDNTKDNDWQISEWHLVDFKTQPASELYFEDVASRRITGQRTLDRIKRSEHQELTSRLVNGGDYFLPAGVTYPFFFPDVTLEHPGVSIVDVDADGFEDIFVAMQHDANLLFHNQGDGTYEESAKKFGLSVGGDCNCALFADFDNDGDADAFIGRGRQPSLYLVNDKGRFTESPAMISMPLPAMVSSISAADYNADGLLDIYVSTYSPIEAEYANNSTPSWVKMFLTDEQAAEFQNQQHYSHDFLARSGPPNLLLQNIGDGKFDLGDRDKKLQLWKMTFQSSWHDFDQDGDPDLYVANDYHQDNFFRNDREAGFTDITEEIGLAEMGFGMGVSFADYDNDGKTDIYVSNMYSKAGQRILSQFDDIDSRFNEMAKGNFLYRMRDGKYELVSGFESPAMQVAKAGWSWGGQFADFNNDSFQDIYVVNGYYSAPDDVALDIDL